MPVSANPPLPSGRRFLDWPGLWLLLPLSCHFGFSWIGFTPTDDGWMLALARRFMDGHVPYRDFIFVFPGLSVLLQMPLLLVGGDHVIWLSRLWGWLTIGAVCWIWSGRLVPAEAPRLLRHLVYVAATLLCAHTFPVQGWHSLDGMLLLSIAVVLAGRNTPVSLRAAFICTGLAGLCRQNFAFFPLILLLAVPHPDKWRAALWTALPPLIYVAATLLAGCLPDFVHQVTSTGGEFVQVAFVRYFRHLGFLLAVPAGATVAWILPRRPLVSWFGSALLLASAGYGAYCLTQGTGAYFNYAFQLFGFVIGFTLIVAKRGWTPADRLMLLGGIGLTWVTAISIGYNSPALMSGVLWCLLWRLIHLSAPTRPFTLLPTTLAALAIGAGFWQGRQLHPYRDRPAADLRWDVGEVLPGGAGLRTNQLTYATLLDLKNLTDRFRAEHRLYGILTDGSAYWIRSPEQNPLPCEWPQATALGYNRKLFARFYAALEAMPVGSRVIVQKFHISEYSWIVAPIASDHPYFEVQNWVRRHFRKVEETSFFAVYEPAVLGQATPTPGN